MKLTKKQAKELSIKKWELVVANDGKPIEHYPPELFVLQAQCGYCEKYLSLNYNIIKLKRCGRCPLIISREYEYSFACDQSDHPFNIWKKNKTRENAQVMLDLILKL